MRCHGVVIDCVGWFGVCGAGECREIRFVLDDDSRGDFRGVRSLCGDGERFSSSRFDFVEHFDEVASCLWHLPLHQRWEIQQDKDGADM